jgi:hypothetical protein
VLENYDDKNYGYLRIVGYVRAVANRVSSGERRPGDQDPDDFVTVDFKSRKLVHFNASDLGRPAAARRIADQ